MSFQVRFVKNLNVGSAEAAHVLHIPHSMRQKTQRDSPLSQKQGVVRELAALAGRFPDKSALTSMQSVLHLVFSGFSFCTFAAALAGPVNMNTSVFPLLLLLSCCVHHAAFLLQLTDVENMQDASMMAMLHLT